MVHGVAVGGPGALLSHYVEDVEHVVDDAVMSRRYLLKTSQYNILSQRCQEN